MMLQVGPLSVPHLPATCPTHLPITLAGGVLGACEPTDEAPRPGPRRSLQGSPGEPS